MTEDNEDLRKDLFIEYQESLRISDAEHCLVMSLYKMKKIDDEIADVSIRYGSGEYDVNTSLVCLDILLEATNEVRDQIKKFI